MKSVLIGIQPQWVEKIANGKKTIEVRKSIPKIDTPYKCYIYCTKRGIELPIERKINRELEDLCDGYEILHWANGKIIGEFMCEKIDKYIYAIDFVHLEDKMYYITVGELEQSCLTYNALEEYGRTKTLYGWHISHLIIYDKPKELKELGIKRPSQSWCYVDEYKE